MNQCCQNHNVPSAVKFYAGDQIQTIKEAGNGPFLKSFFPLFKQAVELRHRVERARLRRRPRVHRSRTFRKKVQRPRSGLQQLITKLKKDST